MPELMTLAEIADALRLPLNTVRKLHHRGDIPAERFDVPGVRTSVRYARAGIAEWIAGMRTSTT